MKVLWVLLLSLTGLTSFSQDYYLYDVGEAKTMMADFIEQSIEEGKIRENPVVIVNNKVVEGYDLDQFNFKKADIETYCLKTKDNQELADTYGAQALNVVIDIQTKPLDKYIDPNNSVLYMVEGEEASRCVLEKLNPKAIEAVNVIKDKDEVATYTSLPYQGVILITLKKTEK